jgi:hypothetical protein
VASGNLKRGAGRIRTGDGGFAIRSETPETPRKQGFPSEAQRRAQQLAQQTASIDPDLQAIIERWPDLPDTVKALIIETVEAGRAP